MNGNEPIMPLVGVDKSKDLFPHNTSGLTKREYFAGLAMQGILSSCDPEQYPFIDPMVLAKQSVIYANTLIAELDKTEKP